MSNEPNDRLDENAGAGVAAGARDSASPTGAVQPFGFLIAVSPDWTVEHASRNTSLWLTVGLDGLCGHRLTDVLSAQAIHAIRGRLQLLNAPDLIERIFGLVLQDAGPPFDVAIHRSGEVVIIEAEPSLPEEFNTADLLRNMTRRLQQTPDIPMLCREATRLMRVLTGFDRVMVFRFDPDGSGEVIAESIRSDQESTIGWRYPASGLPHAARALYERNWLRIVTDVNAEPSAILSRPGAGRRPLDLSMSFLRSVAPSHREFLDQMGVAASLSVSILRAGKLWGLLACHNVTAKHVSFEFRTAFELFGQMFSWLLESREREMELQREARARRLYDQLMSVMATGATTLAAVTDHFDQLATTLNADGIGAWLDGDIKLSGATPSSEQFTQLVHHLSTVSANRIVATNEIATLHEPAAAYTDRAAGLLAIPISRTAGDYLVFFRRESLHTVFRTGTRSADATAVTQPAPQSAGPAMQIRGDIVRGQSLAWTDEDLRFAESLRIMLLDVILRLTAVADDERKSAQDRQELLIAELNHRVRNILGLIHGLVTQSRAGVTSVDEYAVVIGGRIQALARAHDQITQRRWEPGALRDLFVSEASAYLGGQADRVRLNGGPILVDPRAFSALALVVHELMTNSAKYGALRNPAGRIDVTWTLEATQGLVIDWRETGGPPVAPPTRRGFGTTIIERSIPYELKGRVHVRYETSGVEARLVIPVDFAHLAPPGTEPSPSESSQVSPSAEPGLAGTALVVEDNIIIALDAEEMLQELGAERVETAASVREALQLIEMSTPGFALLDLNLGSETSLPVAQRLRELGVSVIFATGYGDNHSIPPNLRDIPVVDKPFTIASLRAALGKLLGS